jgi:exosome complex component RRP42
MSTLLHTTLSHPSLLPASLSLGAKKAWRISLDAIVQSDGGNVYDALFMGARAALHSTRVPRTRSVSYRKTGVQAEDESGLDTRKQAREANDFELVDYWDEGEILDGRERWPVCVTLNVVSLCSYSFNFLGAAKLIGKSRLMMSFSWMQAVRKKQQHPSASSSVLRFLLLPSQFYKACE